MAFETFAATELLGQAQWQTEPVRLHHYRDEEKREVDLVLERRDGAVVGADVKASASGTRSDGERLAAVPLAGLWS